MKKSTIRRLMDVPGAHVSIAGKDLRVGGSTASAPWFGCTLEVGVLIALPRVGVPMVLTPDDPLQFGRFVSPALFDTFERPETLRRFLGLGESSPGEYVTPVEPGSEGIAREVITVLRKMKRGDDWKSRFTAGVASGFGDALSNSIAVAGGSSDWAKAIVEATEAAEAAEAAAAVKKAAKAAEAA